MECSIKKQTEEKLYSVYYLRKRLKAYSERLRKLQHRSGIDNTTEIEYIKTRILETQDAIEDITFVVDQLAPDEQLLIEQWYFNMLPQKEVSTKLFITGTSSIYRRRNIALKHFYDVFPW